MTRDNDVRLSSFLKLAPKVTLKAMGQNEGGVLLKLDSGVPVNIDNSVQPEASLTPQPDNG